MERRYQARAIMSEYDQKQQQVETTIFSFLSQFSRLKIRTKKIAAQGRLFFKQIGVEN
jgi:hypothetical protein